MASKMGPMITMWKFIVIAALIGTTIAAARHRSGGVFSKALINAAHGMLCSIWLGAAVYSSAFQGVKMLQILPRHIFGQVQAQMFPLFFMFGNVCCSLALVTYCLQQPLSDVLRSSDELVQATMLVMALLCSALNSFLIVPTGNRIMDKCHQLEREAGTGQDVMAIDTAKLEGNQEYKRLRKQFGMWHGSSMITGIVSCLCMAYRVAYITSDTSTSSS